MKVILNGSFSNFDWTQVAWCIKVDFAIIETFLYLFFMVCVFQEKDFVTNENYSWAAIHVQYKCVCQKIKENWNVEPVQDACMWLKFLSNPS